MHEMSGKRKAAHAVWHELIVTAERNKYESLYFHFLSTCWDLFLINPKDLANKNDGIQDEALQSHTAVFFCVISSVHDLQIISSEMLQATVHSGVAKYFYFLLLLLFFLFYS